MKKEDFALALNALLPECRSDAVQKWADFAVENVANEQFAYFERTEDRTAAVEKWLDATYAGLQYVGVEYGSEIAARVANLSCEQCALYPGEMLQAAEVLKNGGNAEQIKRMMQENEIEASEPFFYNLPSGAAFTQTGSEVGIKQVGVPYGLFQRRIEPGYMLANGIALLECEKDAFGRYFGGAGMDGMYLKTNQLYVPVFAEDGQIRAFQQVKPENYLAAAEMGSEVNYNQIDGIINNEAPKISVRDALKKCCEKAEKSGAQEIPKPHRNPER